jgi:hypothetical protein
MKNNSKKIINNKRNNKNKKHFSKKSCYKGGKQGSPTWKQYGYKTEDDYIQYQEEQRRRERLVREINKVLVNPIIQTMIMVIMNNEQAERFQTYIRENIRIEENIQNYNQMIRDFINQALELLDDQQRILTGRIMNAIQQERIKRARLNQPFGRLEMLDTIERVVRENMDEIVRSESGGGKKKYYKRYTSKNKLNRRK